MSRQCQNLGLRENPMEYSSSSLHFLDPFQANIQRVEGMNPSAKPWRKVPHPPRSAARWNEISGTIEVACYTRRRMEHHHPPPLCRISNADVPRVGKQNFDAFLRFRERFINETELETLQVSIGEYSRSGFPHPLTAHRRRNKPM